MKFNVGDKVVFIHSTNTVYAWKLCKYYTYIILEKYFDNYNSSYYVVKDSNGTESSWYNEKDFVSLKEYRKMKLNKLILNDR